MITTRLCVIFSFCIFSVNSDTDNCEDSFNQKLQDVQNCNEKSLKLHRYSESQTENFCQFLGTVYNCTEKSFKIFEACPLQINWQLHNHIKGLKAFMLYECKNESKKEIPEFQGCQNEKNETLAECDALYKYNISMFQLILPEKIFDKSLYTDEDCKLKLNWANCWTDALEECENKEAFNYYNCFFRDILTALPSCTYLMEEKADIIYEDASNESNSLHFLFVMAELGFLSLAFYLLKFRA